MSRLEIEERQKVQVEEEEMLRKAMEESEREF
jgi:hypothetical protein